MKQAGLNVLDTYVEWALHNPQDGVYDFNGIANLTHFLDIAVAEGFLVILRPGPYICAERDNVIRYDASCLVSIKLSLVSREACLIGYLRNIRTSN